MFLGAFVLFSAYKRIECDHPKVGLEFISFLNNTFIDFNCVLHIVMTKVLEMQKVRIDFGNKILSKNLLLIKFE